MCFDGCDTDAHATIALRGGSTMGEECNSINVVSTIDFLNNVRHHMFKLTSEWNNDLNQLGSLFVSTDEIADTSTNKWLQFSTLNPTI